MAHTDAVTGIAVTGETITGTWWAEPAEAALKLAAYAPSVSIVSGPIITITPAQAVLVLKAYVPVAQVIESVTLAAPQAKLKLAARAPTLTISSTSLPPQARLLLVAGPATIVFVGQVWLHDLDCEDLTLVTADCSTLVLAAADCSTVPLAPLTPRYGGPHAPDPHPER